MRTNIDLPLRAKTYTGAPKEWPDGLYRGGPNDLDIQVRNSVAHTIGNSDLIQYEEDRVVRTPCTRIPGFTGRIATIEFEREGDSE